MGRDWRGLAAGLVSLAFLVALTHLALYESDVVKSEKPTSQTSPPPIAVFRTTPVLFPTSSSAPSQVAAPKLHFRRTSRRLPQAIIIGVKKCGTRALLEMLYLHPGVTRAAGEIHFFDKDQNYNKGLDWYRKRMPHSFKGQITIEKSPSYFVTPEVPERIRAMNSSVKLLLIVREPVTRAISDYVQLKTHAATAASPTPQFKQLSFEQLAIHGDGSVNIAYRPIALSLYHIYMHRWLEVFPRQQLLVVNGDRLIEDPVSELERIESFLGLEHRISRQNFYFNRTKGFYCLRNGTEDKCLRESKGRKHPRVDPKGNEP
ncbi:heparan sulfate glucosamine 3-O-sulfotransferase 5 isoform X2 [Cimex lectularius]|uniref:Sulfotransferase domain-containing protein n=1 Tax=Cimex lectularius TaxID=79782 RepID=A0A8I6SSP8_CIMLE|nr:heparan sulfate glucosamine 3-O-sulfotransferase 5 isoform X2 [Cimex lectularius]